MCVLWEVEFPGQRLPEGWRSYTDGEESLINRVMDSCLGSSEFSPPKTFMKQWRGCVNHLGVNVAILKHNTTSTCLHSSSNTPLIMCFFCSNLLIFLCDHGLKCNSSPCPKTKI